MTEPAAEWSCFYCDKGKVLTIPAKCPECGHELKKPFMQMSEVEQGWAWIEKKTGMTKDGTVEIHLAS